MTKMGIFSSSLASLIVVTMASYAGAQEPAKQPVAKDVLLANDRESRRRKTLLDANNSECQRGWRQGKGFCERRHRRRGGKAVVRKDMGKPLTRAIRPGGKHYPFAACLQCTHMADGSAKHIGIWVCALGGEDAPWP